MAVTALKLRIMPSSPEINLEQLKKKIKEKLKKVGAIRIDKIEEEEIAFGLKALIVTIAWPENLETEKAENIEVEEISSVKIIDYRRAFG